MYCPTKSESPEKNIAAKIPADKKMTSVFIVLSNLNPIFYLYVFIVRGE